MKRFCPESHQYAAIRIDPVAMVAHFQDPVATAMAQALHPKTYLVYLNDAIDLPFPSSEWFRFDVSPIGTTLHPEDPAHGISSDMAIPIYPNTQHPTGRAPVRTKTSFPFSKCYHWADNLVTVRIRSRPDKYDDSAAVKVSSREHLRMEDLLWQDSNRIDEFLQAREEQVIPTSVIPRPASPSSQDSRLSDGSDDDTEGLIRMDIFNLFPHEDDENEELLPLVDVWFDLDTHLTEDDIPSPLEFDKERAAVAQ
ncbi:hypothetical protein C2E23DRAFT_744022 [Lenzites betulinus]|nr:hypothetical protein C2E23DRAFT_744022 [Lenzites betulinus]